MIRAHDVGVKLLLCACLFAVACKDEAAKPTPAEPRAETTPHTANPAAPRPALPQATAPETPRDWSDPAVREEMRQRREERRKEREAMLDTNHDGVVSPDERKERLRPMVDRLDQNHDGKLTVDELKNGRMQFEDPAAVDTDHNGEISLTELDAAVTARREEMREHFRMRRGGSGAGPD